MEIIKNNMQQDIVYLLVYVLLINIIAFLIYGIDKYRAKKGKYRISENALMFFVIIGGSIGAIIGMCFFHHKTKKSKFYIGVPSILIIQIVIIIVGVVLIN